MQTDDPSCVMDTLERRRAELQEIQHTVPLYLEKDIDGSIKMIAREINKLKYQSHFEAMEHEGHAPPHEHKVYKRGIKIICSICKNDKFDIVNNTTHICRNCGNQKDVFNISPTHKDTSRISTLSRYTYKRRIHFKDCINQYQGKQNTNISDDVYRAIIEKIHLYNLNDGTDYSRVTKEQIMMFLKDVSHGKYYEDINLIYKTITNKPVDDIGYLEELLISDFNMLTDLYDKKFKHTNRIVRKSFINTQYVLFQLLRRHRHPCRSEDFNILKTIDRKSIHEEIISELFDELGWNFTSLF